MSSEGAPETLTGTAESQAPPTESDLPTPPRSRTTSIAEDPPAAASDDNTEENPPEMTTSSLSKSTSELSMASGGGGVATAASSPAGPTVIAWGETLKSPTLAAFSPAQVPSRHGLALQLATERAKLLNKTNKRCLALLTEVATLYDHYATALIRASQGLATHPALVHPLQECVVSWSGETSKMSATLRSDVAQPMLVYLGTTHADAVTGVAQRYQQARQEATAVRQRALAAATKYRQVTGGEEGSSNSRATSRDKYERLVKWENECVQQCQRLEGMALETLQKMEEDRLFVFVRGLVKALHAQRQALEETIRALAVNEEEEEDAAGGGTVGTNKTASMRFMFTRVRSQESEASGVMDAETLGLPIEMGELRDKARSKLEARRERVQATKTLATFMEQVAKACQKLGTSILQVLRKDIGANDALHVSMGSCEGARVLRLWDCLVSFLEAEANDHIVLSEQLRNLRGAKLDTIILNGDRSVKAAMESDEASWKQLCEATRTQSRAESRYRQTTAETAKARDRIQSEGSVAPGMMVGQHMTKGLGKLFEMMPNGGEHAMKILPSGARVSLAQRSLEEADQREAKNRQQMDTAVEVSGLALDAYKTQTDLLLTRFDEDESGGWESVKRAMVAFVQQLQTVRQSHLDTLVGKESMIQQLREDAFADMNEWRTKAQQELVSKCVEKEPEDSTPNAGFQLEVQLESGDAVTETGAAALDTSVEDDIDPDDLEDTIHEEEEEVPTASGSPKQVETEGNEENRMKKLFRRSISAPPNLRKKLALRGKLRRGRHRTESDHGDFETDLFLTYFWPDMVDVKKVPTIVDSFSCSFRDGAHALPFQYGRVFLTPNRIIFTSWTKKKLNLTWAAVTQVKPSKGFHGMRGDTIHVICKKKDSNDVSCMTLGGFYDRAVALEQIEKLRGEEKIVAEQIADTEAEAAAEVSVLSEKSVTDIVAPDEKIGAMHMVVSKPIHNISVQKFFDVIWLEKEKPLYEPWLSQSAFDITIDGWKEGACKGPWCGEEYQMSRSARFKVKRTTHLYIGPPIANVVQTHRCRIEGNDRCVTAMTIEFEGIPYSDTFAVEVRYVISRDGNDIKYECGIFVDFRKTTFLKRQIQGGTIQESTPVYRNFFKVAHAACIEAQGGDAALPEEEEAEEEKIQSEKAAEGFQAVVDELQKHSIYVVAFCFLIFVVFLRRVFSSKYVPPTLPETPDPVYELDELILRMGNLETQMNQMQHTLDELVNLLKGRSTVEI